MEPSDLIKKSQNIKNIASSILDNSKLLTILAKHGDPEIIGSYKYDVMYAPDIDIVVITDNPRRDSVEALKDLVDQRSFQKYQYGDFVKFPRENRPQGYIVVLILEIDNVKWEVEVWFLDKRQENVVEIDNLMSNLTPKQRNIILKLKDDREKSGLDKKNISSTDIYRAVILDNKVSLNQIDK